MNSVKSLNSNKSDAKPSVSEFSWNKVWDLISPIWSDPSRPTYMRSMIVFRVLVLIMNPILCIWITFPMGEMVSSLQDMDADKFYAASKYFTCLLIVCCPVWALDFFMGEWLRMTWRQWLTKHLMKRYFRGDNFYHLINKPELDNPGMRICDDVAEFIWCFLCILDKFSVQFLRAIGFGYVLYTLAPQMLPWLMVYALIGTFGITWGFGEKLAKWNAGKFFLTANFRAGLLRSRENAESIAFYRAGKYEQKYSESRLDMLINNLFQLAKTEAWLRLCRNCYMWVAEGAPYIILAPSFLAGNIKFGVITQADEAFRSILRGTNMIIENLSHITALEATTQRIYAVIEAFDKQEGVNTLSSKQHKYKDAYDMLYDMEAGDESAPEFAPIKGPDAITNGELILENFTVTTPDRKTTLAENLTLNVEKGQSLLIVGPSGVGKSSLLRSICGLWPKKQGKIMRPDHKDMMFLPQVPYIPDIPISQNTLKKQLIFPRTFCTNSDAEMIAALKRVNLTHLLGPNNSVMVCDDWRKRLSGGEKQRLAMARLLLQSPKMAFLDESTSALDDENEKLLYKTMQSKGASYVSVGHRKELFKYHSHVLELNKDKSWTVKPSPAFIGFSG